MRINSSLRAAINPGGLPLLIFVFLLTLLPGCKKDNNGGLFINAGTQTFSVNGLNNCNTSTGKGSTLLLEIPYTASSGLEISQLRIKTKVSDGGSNEAVNPTFSDDGSTVGWATCMRYGSQSWVEFEVQLESSGGVRSNITSVRIDRPDGAN